ncbi:MAG TPA: NeuD/PglB/VioB family sugar acetyltransferase [Ramlibacter sp.]|nr:NeuD/PglB/VioB family sugar acetyltransferase [Ramlibacter sp.]
MSTLLIFGAGGHGRVVADAALRQAAWSRLVASDRNPARQLGQLLPGVPLQALTLEGGARLHVAIGQNGARKAEASALGLERLASVVHPMASVSDYAIVADGCFIAAQAVVAPGAVLHAGVIVNHGAVVDHDVRVGAFSHIAPGATLGGEASVGEGVLVGAGAVLLPGVAVCDGVVIGAGAVVRGAIDEPGVYAGVPARRIA